MNKTPLSNKTDFQMMCIVIAIPVNSILFFFSVFFTIAQLIAQDWSFWYGVCGIVLFGMNVKSIFSLMDYPDK